MLSSKRSVKTRRSHRTAAQRKRRAWSISTARRPAIGKSAKRRGYRLWTRSETAPHDGHELFALIARIVRTALSPSLNAQNPVGSNSEARKGCDSKRCGVCSVALIWREDADGGLGVER